MMTRLLQHRRLRSFMVVPPCATFSPAAHPAGRSYKLPQSFRPAAPKTLLGRVLALNHVAMPWQLLLAAIATSLVWGWPRVAGLLALTWGGLLRIGEASAARRSDLLLPGDVKDTCDYALLSVDEPKTRYKAARHQAAKIDQPDLLGVVSSAFGSLGFS